MTRNYIVLRCHPLIISFPLVLIVSLVDNTTYDRVSDLFSVSLLNISSYPSSVSLESPPTPFHYERYRYHY